MKKCTFSKSIGGKATMQAKLLKDYLNASDKVLDYTTFSEGDTFDPLDQFNVYLANERFLTIDLDEMKLWEDDNCYIITVENPNLSQVFSLIEEQ